MSGAAKILRPGGSKPASGASKGAAVRVAAGWLCLAATPTFACMALLSALGGNQPDILCTAMQRAAPLGGMTLMYLLMNTFHAGPWLKLVAGR
ncbi:MAG TPA: hypothetical protein VMF32_13405 [Xanthobacteraceae bacterium]|nr:hypothetical protein [Xanthobacteraceae bacterium]